MNVLEYSKQIQTDADELLKETGILDLYRAFGNVNLVGSYATNLMWDPDIDVVVVTDTPHVSAMNVVQALMESATFQKIEFGDFLHFPRKNRPESFIVNARREWKGKVWEIETWFLESVEEKLAFVEKLNALPEEMRMQILEDKKKRAEEGSSKHALSSYDIYTKYLKVKES